MTLVAVKRSCFLVADVSKKINLLGCYFQGCSVFQAQQLISRMNCSFRSRERRSFWLNLNKSASYPNEIHPVIKYLAVALNIPMNSVFKTFMKCPRRNLIRVIQVKSTVEFLIKIGFTSQVIADTLAICFYDQECIKMGLRKIAENEAELSKLGFTRGFTRDVEKNFSNSTTSTDKRLQLCLYYMELPFEFSGGGWLYLPRAEMKG